MGPVPAALRSNALASLAVLGVVALFAFGLPALDRSLPGARPVAAGVAYPVGGSVTVVPPSGSSVDLTRTRPGTDRGTALFFVDGVRLALVVTPYDGDLAGAVERLHHKITKTSGGRITGAGREIRTALGVRGFRGSYTSAGRFGRYAVFVNGQAVVEATASGSEIQLRALEREIEEAMRSVSFGGGQ